MASELTLVLLFEDDSDIDDLPTREDVQWAFQCEVLEYEIEEVE